MNSYIQLFCLALSFVYGCVICLLNNFNYKLLRSKNILLKLFVSGLYIFDISLLYIVILYIVNDGILHIYFILLMIFGYILTLKYVNKKNSLN